MRELSTPILCCCCLELSCVVNTDTSANAVSDEGLRTDGCHCSLQDPDSGGGSPSVSLTLVMKGLL